MNIVRSGARLLWLSALIAGAACGDDADVDRDFEESPVQGARDAGKPSDTKGDGGRQGGEGRMDAGAEPGKGGRDGGTSGGKGGRDAATPRADAAAGSGDAAAAEDEDASAEPGSDGGSQAGGEDAGAPSPLANELPIVFVHGLVGSAQQYESQAMRFGMNGYPVERIRAYEHDGQGLNVGSFVQGADAVIDAVREEFKTDKVYLVGHSRGTFVGNQYIGDRTRAAKVAKYIALDGAPCPSGSSVPCLAPNQANLPGQTHVEVSTSAESFAKQFEFLFGKAPATTEIVAQGPTASISGRVLNFPANTGRACTLELWELDSATGARVGMDPVQRFTVGASGDFGPVTVSTEKHYEFVVSASDTENQHHFYMQRFLRDSKFVRLLSGPPDTPTRMNTNVSDAHAAITISRQREWTQEDKIEISTMTPSGSQPPVNVITPRLTAGSIAIHAHDAKASPGDSTLMPLPWFVSQPFQTGVDVYMPAADPPTGTITVRSVPRGAPDKPQVLTLPNWISSRHVSAVVFADYAQ